MFLGIGFGFVLCCVWFVIDKMLVVVVGGVVELSLVLKDDIVLLLFGVEVVWDVSVRVVCKVI